MAKAMPSGGMQGGGRRPTRKRARRARTARPKAPNPIPPPRVLSTMRLGTNVRKLGHHASACSVYDPFCTHARGAQRPDGGPSSIPFQVRFLQTVSTLNVAGGVGRGAVVANPLYALQGYPTYVAPTYSGSSSFSATPTSSLGLLATATNVGEMRITSFGVIFRSSTSATSSQGCVILTTTPRPTYQNVDGGAISGAESVIVSLASGAEYTWISKPLGPDAHLMKEYAFWNTSTLSDFPWTSFTYEFLGAAQNTAVATIEVVMNVEFTVNTEASSQGLAQLQKAPPKPNPVALQAASRAQVNAPSFIQGGITKASDTLSKWAMAALDDVMSEGLALLTL